MPVRCVTERILATICYAYVCEAAAAAGAIFACKVSAAVHGCAAVRAIVIGIRNVVKRP